jgi:phosphinothricin acetyltransferase
MVNTPNNVPMVNAAIRLAVRGDVPRLTEIYNHYVRHTAVTFDLEEWTVDRRFVWFEQFAPLGRHQLLVAEENGRVIGYAGTTRFRLKAAYDPTVETTIYCAPEAVGKGIGAQLYAALFETLASEDIHRIVAGYTLPNSGSEALHKRFGFTAVGIFRENGRKFGKYWDVAWTDRPLKLSRIGHGVTQTRRG